MNNNEHKRLESDPDGLLSYEYLANHIDEIDSDILYVIENIIRVDQSGRFTASAARYLNAISPQKYADAIASLVNATIGKDREHRYLPDILRGIYGPDYNENADTLAKNDDNFRRIYKRLYPEHII